MERFRHRIVVLGLAALLVFAVASWADVFLMDYAGFDWMSGGELGDPGSCYQAVGFVNDVNPTFLSFDYDNFEYTFHLENSCFVNADTVGGFGIFTYSGPATSASFDVYCDPLMGGTAADYGENPPNATSPSTFIDGENVLGGDFATDLIFVVDLFNNSGSMTAHLDFTRGTQLGNIPPESRQHALSLNGVLQVDFNGYTWNIDGDIRIEEPTPVERTTWGNLKQVFVGEVK